MLTTFLSKGNSNIEIKGQRLNSVLFFYFLFEDNSRTLERYGISFSLKRFFWHFSKLRNTDFRALLTVTIKVIFTFRLNFDDL